MKSIRRPSVFPVAFLFVCGLSLTACNGNNKISWEQDKESVITSIETLDAERKKEAVLTNELLAEVDSRLLLLEEAILSQQAQVELLLAQLEEQKRVKERERIEAQKRVEEQKRKLEKKLAAELKQIQLQKKRQLALQKAKKIAAAKKASERKRISIPEKQVVTLPAIVPAATAETEKDAYTAAYLALKSGRFVEASKGFNEQLDLYPDGEFSDQAWYWLGETRYAQRAYGMASNAFKYIANNYPMSVKRASALLKLGEISQILNRNDEAISYYNRLINEHGGSNSAEQAREALVRMQDNPKETQP